MRDRSSHQLQLLPLRFVAFLLLLLFSQVGMRACAVQVQPIDPMWLRFLPVSIHPIHAERNRSLRDSSCVRSHPTTSITTVIPRASP